MRDETRRASTRLLLLIYVPHFVASATCFCPSPPSFLAWVIRQVPEWLKIAACLGSNYVKLLFIFQFRFVFPQASTVFLLFIIQHVVSDEKLVLLTKIYMPATTTTTALVFVAVVVAVGKRVFIFTNITNLAWVAVSRDCVCSSRV